MNLRALGKVTRIGCKYEPSFTIYIFRASPSWGLAQGQLHFCVLPYVAQPSDNNMSQIFRAIVFVGLLSRRPESQWTCACPLFIMVCLNGVHVEAKGHWSVTTSVTLALAFYYASWEGGAPSPQQNADLKRQKVRALYLCCVTSFFCLLLFTIVFILEMFMMKY